jgi:hypothetical protein
LTVDPGFTEMRYKLQVFDGVQITQAHLHCNETGSNGPVVAFLFPVRALSAKRASMPR